jgi:lysophospholipase L1-like esterase
MPFIVLACALICAAFPVFAQNGGPPLQDERVLWLGDSITEAGDYVTLVEYELDKRYPSTRFDFIGIGLASETVSCLSEKDHPFPRPCVLDRLERALDLVKPQVVFVCYGMNDGIYHPQSPERMAAFQKGIHAMIDAVKAKGAMVILLTPPPFDRVPVTTLLDEHAPDFSYKAPFERYDEVLSGYAAWEKTLSPEDATVIDLHTPMNAFLLKKRIAEPKFSFTKDGIHPDVAGHLLMARTILIGLGVPLGPADLTEVAARLSNDPLYTMIKSRRESRSKAWLDYVGYTRDKTVKSTTVEAAEQAAQTMQLEIDRLRETK